MENLRAWRVLAELGRQVSSPQLVMRIAENDGDFRGGSRPKIVCQGGGPWRPPRAYLLDEHLDDPLAAHPGAPDEVVFFSRVVGRNRRLAGFQHCAHSDQDIRLETFAHQVVERHRATGNVGVGFVRGFKLRRGAIGSTVAHDAHNVVVAGTNDADILCAIQQLERMQGGQVAVANGKIKAELPLPIAGLVSDRPLKEGVGLRNTRSRIEALGGGAGSFRLVTPAAGGLLVEITLPWRTTPASPT